MNCNLNKVENHGKTLSLLRLTSTYGGCNMLARGVTCGYAQWKCKMGKIPEGVPDYNGAAGGGRGRVPSTQVLSWQRVTSIRSRPRIWKIYRFIVNHKHFLSFPLTLIRVLYALPYAFCQKPSVQDAAKSFRTNNLATRGVDQVLYHCMAAAM